MKGKVLVERREILLDSMIGGNTIDQIIANFAELKEEFDKAGYDYTTVEVDWYYDYFECYIDLYREETDEEYAERLMKELEKVEKARIKKEQAAEKKRLKALAEEEKERQMYHELKEQLKVLEEKYGEANV